MFIYHSEQWTICKKFKTDPIKLFFKTMIIKVEVKNDHLQTISQARPLYALAELIWNSFDADATDVKVSLRYNKVDGLEEIRVIDNGHGISFDDVQFAFKNLGGSWKSSIPRSKKENRILHGKAGKGRFKAFSLGSHVEWITRYQSNGQIKEYTIVGTSNDLGSFEIGEENISSSEQPGTEVIVSNLFRNFTSLHPKDNTFDEITMIFALYMRQYPHIKLDYEGFSINPSRVEEKYTEFNLPKIKISDCREIDSQLTIIEWNSNVERMLFLCDEDGFALSKTSPGIQAPGFNFTAYLKSDYIKELNQNGYLLLDDLHEDLKLLIDAAKTQLRNYFRERSAELVNTRVEEWKKTKIYPYIEEPKDIVEKATRQVFDICALNISDYLHDFEGSSPKNKKTTLWSL